MSILTKEQTAAHELIPLIRKCFEEHVKHGREMMSYAIQTGEHLLKAKKLLPHGEFGPFVEQYFDFDMRTASTYMRVAEGVKKLPKEIEPEDMSIRGLLKYAKESNPPASRGKSETASDLEPRRTKPPSQSDAPPADADDDAEFNDHVAPARPVISGGDVFEPAEFAAVEANFAERVRMHNLEIGRYAARIKDSYEPYPASNQLESKLTVIKQQIQSVVGTILTCKVHDKPCPKCEDNGKPCKVCGGCGMVTKMTYDGMGGK